MFGRKRIKELEALYMTELEKSCKWQWKYEQLVKTQFTCEDCNATFNTPDFKAQKINQAGRLQYIAVCPKCGSRHLNKRGN